MFQCDLRIVLYVVVFRRRRGRSQRSSPRLKSGKRHSGRQPRRKQTLIARRSAETVGGTQRRKRRRHKSVETAEIPGTGTVGHHRMRWHAEGLGECHVVVRWSVIVVEGWWRWQCNNTGRHSVSLHNSPVESGMEMIRTLLSIVVFSLDNFLAVRNFAAEHVYIYLVRRRYACTSTAVVWLGCESHSSLTEPKCDPQLLCHGPGHTTPLLPPSSGHFISI